MRVEACLKKSKTIEIKVVIVGLQENQFTLHHKEKVQSIDYRKTCTSSAILYSKFYLFSYQTLIFNVIPFYESFIKSSHKEHRYYFSYYSLSFVLMLL